MVAGEVMRDAREFFQYCKDNLTVEDGTRMMLTRKFFFISNGQLDEQRALIDSEKYPKSKEIMKVHQATTTSEPGKVRLFNFYARLFFIATETSLYWCTKEGLKISMRSVSECKLYLLQFEEFKYVAEIRFGYIND